MADEEERPEGGGTPAAGPVHRTGYVAIAGVPNAGKSTLMNRLMQERLAIVTPKPQTTRRRTLGILSGADYQMVLLDTPGLMEPRYDLHHAMLREARGALMDADVILLMAEPWALPEVPEMVREATAPRVLALNKVDLVKNKAELLPALQGWHDTGLFRELLPISALNGTGTEDLLKVLVALLPGRPPVLPARPDGGAAGALLRRGDHPGTGLRAV